MLLKVKINAFLDQSGLSENMEGWGDKVDFVQGGPRRAYQGRKCAILFLNIYDNNLSKHPFPI